MNTPTFPGYTLTYSGHAKQDESTCPHADNTLTTYVEDGGRFAACRDCGAIGEMVKRDAQ
jgi:hypothetical protein